MNLADRLFRAVGVCLISAGILTSAISAKADTVSNTATAQWRASGTDFSTDSNTVSFEVREQSARLTTLAPMPGGQEEISLQPSYCSTGIATQGLQSLASGGTTSVVETDTIRVGQTLVIRIDAPAANRDPSAEDRLTLRLVTPTGDEEELTAVEEGANSGVFYAAIGTVIHPPPVVKNDCRLSLEQGETVDISAYIEGQDEPVLFGSVAALADPFGVVFDSLDGRPVDGARVTIIDVATGQPAQVFALDGVTPYPSTVISGESATDANGDVYDFAPGEYRFPLVAFGEYRLLVEPPAPYTAPSEATPQQLATLTRPDGGPFIIADGSYLLPFTVDSIIPVQLDVPVDAPGGLVSITKDASREIAEPGDVVFYSVTVRNTDRARPSREIALADSASPWLRLRPDSVRVDGDEPATGLSPAADGRGFTLALGPLAGGESRRVTYAMRVRPDAPPGFALNRVTASSPDGNSATVEERVRITRDTLTGRMTIIGRVTDGGCSIDESEARGIPGVRVMMEDGSFAITDLDGRYHFDGVVPGNHVVQVSGHTLPEGGEFVDCARSSRSQGSPISRLVTGLGGSLVRADFVATLPEGTEFDLEFSYGDAELSDPEAAGAETDWLAMGDGENGFLFPAMDHNPRSQAVRVVVRHRANQSAALTADGKAVDPLSFEGVRKSPDGRYAVSVWRGIRLDGPTTRLSATINNAGGHEVESFTREVHFSSTPMRAELISDRSRLLADGSTQPVLAVRFTDRYGRPVHSGISGTMTVEAPYEVASAIEARQTQALTGFGNTQATWTVRGDDGIAYIALAPTMVSGALRADFEFTDGETTREQEFEAWIEPGDMPWTLIGLAEGSIGARSVAENMEQGGNFDSDLGDNARVAFYAKGRVLGKYLLTIAYDSAKQESEQRLLGTIDPAAYYTVYGDGSQRLFDAASREKLYLRIESSTFYAMFGDFVTGFDETFLARYQRTATGVKAEARLGQVETEGFVAKIGSRFRRDEIQGAGNSGPYSLSSRAIIANSEKVAIEVRDRLRSEIIIERRELTRFIDYDVDLLSGTITFAQPILSRDPSLNPQFIVVEYEVDKLGDGEWNGGLRATWTSENGQLRIGATGITDKGDTARSNLGAVDMRLRLGEQTEIRAEAAFSEQDGNSAAAFSAEVEHNSGPFDLLAYVRRVEQDFGVGQQNIAERGRMKIGADARVQVAENWTVIASAWHDESLFDDAERDAVELRTAYRSDKTDAYFGVAHISDTLSTGGSANSTVLEAGATQRLLGNKLELSASTAVPLSDTDSIDLPARHRFGARYAITNDVKALATYEIARGDAIDANTLRAGLEITPWTGGTIVTSLGREALGADSDRTFASFALGQSLRVTEKLTIDATIDGNKTIGGGIDIEDVVNPAHPVSSGGQFGPAGSIGEDFTAFTLGAQWADGPWNARMRGEYRDGEFANRKGFDLAVIRQLGDGRVLGGGMTWTKADGVGGTESEVVDAGIALAHRPADSAFSFLSKIEYRSDSVTNAVAGQAGPAGQTALLVTGDAKSRRILGSISANWSPEGGDEEDCAENQCRSMRHEIGVFAGVRHNFDRFEGFDLSGTTLLGGLDARIGIGEHIEIGGRASVRHNIDDGTTSFAIGPEIGVSPVDNVLVSVGYNIIGFRDPDFSAARNTDKGLFATLRIKFDDLSLEALGIGRRDR